MCRRYRWIVLQTTTIVFVFFTAGMAVNAQPTSRPGMINNSSPRPRIEIPYAVARPRLDGSVDDPAWDTAVEISSLSPSLDAQPAQEQVPATRVRLIWDERFLYVRFTCKDDYLDSPFKERDADHFKGDVVEVFFDPKGDGQQYLELQVGPDNQVLDQLMLLTSPARSGRDLRLTSDVFPRELFMIREWNLRGLRTAVSHQKQQEKITGWVVDIAIPADEMLQRLSLTRFKAGLEMRLNLLRYDWLRSAGPASEKQLLALNWAPVVKGCPHFSPAAMGYITLLPPDRASGPSK